MHHQSDDFFTFQQQQKLFTKLNKRIFFPTLFCCVDVNGRNKKKHFIILFFLLVLIKSKNSHSKVLCAYIYLSVARQSLFKWTDTKHSEKTRVVLHQQATWVHWIHSYYPPKMLSRVCREKKRAENFVCAKRKMRVPSVLQTGWMNWMKKESITKGIRCTKCIRVFLRVCTVYALCTNGYI